MNAAGNICSIALLLCIALQDFRTRTISAWLLPAIAVALLLAMTESADWMSALCRNTFMNCALLIVQFAGLWLFVSARNRKWTNIINTQIGLGDVLLLLCLAPFFSPVNYFLLYTLSIVLALSVTLLLNAAGRKNNDHIPFAGFIAVPLGLLCGLRLAFPDVVHFCSDDWMYAVLHT
jgi:hypothetical protein